MYAVRRLSFCQKNIIWGFVTNCNLGSHVNRVGFVHTGGAPLHRQGSFRFVDVDEQQQEENTDKAFQMGASL